MACIPQVPSAEISQVELQIGKNCADLIHDGDCLQLGIGGIPNAVCAQLWNKKDLGLHSELVGDGVVDLLEAGVINNAVHKAMFSVNTPAPPALQVGL